MTKDSPTPLGGGRASPKKSGSPGPAAAVVEEQKRELEKLRGELEAERARGRAERRHFAAQARQLRESAEQERQQLADHLRSKWEAQRFRDLRQLQEEVQREREAEIRQLLRWKEAELRQLQQLLHRERDGVVRQARELQRQLAQELVNRGYCGRAGAREIAATQCRCRLQEVLAQLRWENDSEQAARIRHLQAALNLERQLFLKYILEHFRWQPALPGSPDPQAVPPLEDRLIETGSSAPCLSKSASRIGSLDNLSDGVRVRSRSLDLVPAACSGSPDDLLPIRATSLDSLATARSCSLDSALSCHKAPESEVRASSTDTSTPGSSTPSLPPLPSPAHRKSNDPGGGEGSGNQPCEALTPSPLGLDYNELAKQNSMLTEALQVLSRRCSFLRQENQQLRRTGFSDQTDERVKRLKVKHAELTGLARRLEDRARKLQETNLRTLSAPVPGESRADLELCQAFARQRTRDLSEQASALLAKDKQIEELRRECHLLQARVATDHGSTSHPEGGAPRAPWLNIDDLDRLQRESQREVLRLQRQLTQQQGQGGAGAEASGPSLPGEVAQNQVQALESELDARRRECEELSAQAAAAQRRGEDAEAQLQAALRKGAWLAEENARLQTQADWVQKMAAENRDVSGQLGRACQARDASDLLAGQLLQQAEHGQDRQQQLQHDLQDFQAAQKERQALQGPPGPLLQQPHESPQTPKSQARGSDRPKFKPGLEDRALPSRDKQSQPSVCLSLQETPLVFGESATAPEISNKDSTSQPLESRPQAKKTSSQSNSSSEIESMWATVPSCFTLDRDTASEVDDLESDSVSASLEEGVSETPTTPKLKIFLARYSYNPFEGPNEHPEGELPLTAGDYVYVFGDMDEDGFYEGELGDGRRGLVPSNLVEQIPDSPTLDCLLLKAPDLSLTALPAEQNKALKKESLSLGEAQVSIDKGPDVAVEMVEKKTEACWLGSSQSVGEQGFCTPLLEAKGGFYVAPMKLHLQSVTATSAEITWVYASSRHPHVVYLDDQEHALIPSGVSCYTFQGLHPGTQYQVRVEMRLPTGLLQVLWETTSSTITFNTPLAGPPDPPLDVLVEHHVSPGFLLVSWLPVTIDSAGFSNGVQVTGYAVYADGCKVAEVTDATAGSTLVEFSQLQVPLTCQKLSVRTTSLYGESLDSVPAQIPEDCFTYHSFLEAPLFSHSCSDPSTCRVTFPVCHQKLAQASLYIKSNPYTCESYETPQATFLEGFPEVDPRKSSPTSSLVSKGAGKQAQGPIEAKKDCGKSLPFQKSPYNHRPPLLTYKSQYRHVSRSFASGFSHPPSEHGPREEPWQEKAALEKALKQKHDDHMFIPCQKGTNQKYATNFHKALEEKEVECLDSWHTGKPDQRKTLKPQSGQGQALGDKRECQLREPSLVLGSAPSNKVLKMSGGSTSLLKSEVNAPARVFVALFDYNPLVMSSNPKAAEEELAFQKGQLLRVRGSQDPHGFYHGEYNGKVGNIPGHLVMEVEVGTELADEKWHLSTQGHFERLTSPQGSLLMPQENSRSPTLWTSKTMVAALDYNPRDERTGGRAKGKLTLRGGDRVTVYGPVDDKGFYYGECNSHRGLVPAHMLDDLSVHAKGV